MPKHNDTRCTCHACRFRRNDYPARPDNEASGPPQSANEAIRRGAITAAAYFGGMVAELAAAHAAGRDPNPDAMPVPGPADIATILSGCAAMLDSLDLADLIRGELDDLDADDSPEAADATAAALARARARVH